jgi:hypothetical protein
VDTPCHMGLDLFSFSFFFSLSIPEIYLHLLYDPIPLRGIIIFSIIPESGLWFLGLDAIFSNNRPLTEWLYSLNLPWILVIQFCVGSTHFS